MLTDISRLTESPGPMLKHPQSGANYHTGEQIITHLNYALGADGWDWEELDHGFDEMGDQVWVRGRLTARFLGHADDHDGYKTTTATRTEKGWKAVSRRRENGALVDIGNDYKGADTDALKRAARLLGVGLDAWQKDAPSPVPQQERRTSAPRQQAAKPATATDLPLPDRATLLERYAGLLEHATSLGYRSSWSGNDPERLSDVQLSKYGDLLGGYIARNTEAAG